ncbi:MAG: hypothetical protein A2Y33_13515 [Spirochaetes bacterium GWF1_51_8]|nr:MAG: hypothetical protein A2Y33_13515 [Spirochaetes bacterium GWF1_51_8]
MLSRARIAGFVILFVAGLYLSSLYNYLLFHSLAEILSIIVSGSIFFITWNSRKTIANGYLVFIGIAYLFVGGIDLIHVISFDGMTIFTGDHYYASQFWIGARLMESISLLAGLFFVKKREYKHPYLTVLIFSIVMLILISSILWWKIFPITFVAGSGQTPFKIISEYVIIAILAAGGGVLIYCRKEFDPVVFKLLLASILLTMIEELFFTLYFTNQDVFNMIGHFFKLGSFYMIYRAIVKTGFIDPQKVLFRELKQSEIRYRELSELLPISLFEADGEGKIFYMNRFMKEQLGLKEDVSPEKNRLLDLFRFEEKDILIRMTRERILGMECELVIDDFMKTPVLFYSAPIMSEDNPAWFKGLIIDVTRQKEQERLLIESNLHLEQFAYIASHDLKAPLHTISGFLSLIQDKVDTCPISDKEMLELVTMAQSTTKRMSVLIQDLIDFSMLGSTKTNFSAVSLNSVIHEAILNLKLHIDESGATITVPELPVVYGDFPQLSRLMLNLLNNAIKYSIHGTPPIIRIEYQKKGNLHSISVIDNGVGIDKDQIGKVFELFHRANSEVEGSGIGLSVCKKIVERHGGTIRVESNPGKGSTFIFTLPAALPDAS